MGNNYSMVAKTLFGFEDILADELRNLGAMQVEKGVRSVSFMGDKGFMYKANLCLRTALKIVKPIRSFRVRNEKDLYDGVYNIPWESFMSVHQTLAVDAVVHSEKFNHTLYVALKTKDAIVDRFRNKSGKRPDVDLKHPDLKISVHIQKDSCTISLDSSGASLHHRGYRTATNIAPINEVLAAGMLLLSGWDGQSDFLDPMCGSGTIPVEAAMIACNIPANINRREFAFEKWGDFDPDLFEKVTESSLNKAREFHHKIYAYDKAPSAVRKTKDNVHNANLSEYIEIEQQDFFSTEKNVTGKLHMVFNPPYGERLALDMERFYKGIGDTLKQNYPNTEAWFITSNMEALKHVGLRPSRKIKLFNGRLESKLVKYEIYEGSKKAKWQQ
ncbi:THUMP domain-containing class I SAM-dependent RNA methyltransferase [Sinomicrobium weinanense]|uniref:Class I SAM-dependent RNA methyltransferase n=1 Tax=Sinomicrobium weinanense TaxID=2842200 RepID=A0A926JSU8_9FLAO|nr:THUMP domain-containing protein [Sinomicrobium weinanense]MBC9796858.1 class I SAM-dependent RNA methyltransferase [Sinomicrobium weinanense]MBU3125231.1 class I SAM-dependent RNA methyltransferase [Sinomicrobium weinanense]